MSRPKTHKTKRTSTAIRFPDHIHQRLIEAAAEWELSVNWLVNRAVADFLDRLIPANELRLTRDSEETR